MEASRTELLRELLRCRLEVESLRRGFDPPQRLAWCSERLAEYAGRLAGALELPGWGVSDLAGSDTVAIVEMGMELLGEEMQKTGAPETAISTWGELQKQWADLNRWGDRERARGFVERCDQMHTLLAPSEYGQQGMS